MVTLEQVEKGVLKYIDSEFVNKISGLRKWGVALMTESIALSIKDMVMKNREFLVKSGYLTEDCMVDIEKLYSDCLEVTSKHGKVTEHFPLIGDVTFSDTDVRSLRDFIVNG